MTDAALVTVDLNAAAFSYDIVIDAGVLARAGHEIYQRLGVRRCVIITDSIVEPLYAPKLASALTAGGHEIQGTLAIPAGEGNKNFTQLEILLNRVLALGVDRKTLIVALGGGVVGDMAGLVASLVLRGLDCVQIPTSLLAQVDSSVGGKTGIDTVYGKNTVGAFFQPRLVLIDVAVLDSLPPRERLAGYAETVKYGLINDAAFFDWCAGHGSAVLAGDRAAQIHAVQVSCAAKAKIVAADEREAGVRALLNLGHTFGHALEAETGYGALFVHGEAVALGILVAMRLSVRLGLCPATDADKVCTHFAAVGLPPRLPAYAYDADRLIGWMTQDKKAEAGKITLILLRGIGQAFVSRDVDVAEIRAVWKEFIAQ